MLLEEKEPHNTLVNLSKGSRRSKYKLALRQHVLASEDWTVSCVLKSDSLVIKLYYVFVYRALQ